MNKTFIFFLFLSVLTYSEPTRKLILKNSKLLDSKIISAKDLNVCFNPLKDERQDSILGHVQNRLGSKIAEVVAKTDVRKWVNDEMLIRFKNAGYHVKYPCDTLNNYDLTFSGSILKVYSTAFAEYYGEVIIDANFSISERSMANRKYIGYTDGSLNFLSTKGEFEEVIEETLKLTIDKILIDLNRLDSLISLLKKGEEVEINLTKNEIGKSTSKKNIKCSVKNGKIIKKGNRDKHSITSKLSKVKSDMKSLYAGRVELNNELSGNQCVYFVISPEGVVKDVELIKTTVTDEVLNNTLISKVKNLEFTNRNKYVDTEVTLYLNYDAKKYKTNKATLGLLSIMISCGLLIWTLLR